MSEHVGMEEDGKEQLNATRTQGLGHNSHVFSQKQILLGKTGTTGQAAAGLLPPVLKERGSGLCYKCPRSRERLGDPPMLQRNVNLG